jgi:hypothetical protein
MSAPSTKSFCVRFTATSSYKITVAAETPRQAIAKARKLWATKGDEPFTPWAGDTDGWEAFPD